MKLRTLVVICILSLVAVSASIGCASLSEFLTPATIDPRAVSYVVEAGVADANEFKGWKNLEKALRLDSAVDSAYEVQALAIQQMEEKNQLDYALLNDVVSKNLKSAQAREETLFGSEGLISLGLGMAGMGGFAGLLGLSRKRPGDLTPSDFEAAIVPFKGEAAIREKQFAQVVTGVERFIKAKSKDEKMDTVLKELKTFLGRAQDETTAVEVAKVRAIV